MISNLKRYRLCPSVTQVVRDVCRLETEFTIESIMSEDLTGEWVSASEVEKLIESLEARIPELRIARLEKALGLIEQGKCPECGQKVNGWASPTGSFAPEAYATLRERGVDPDTGHLRGCSRRAEK